MSSAPVETAPAIFARGLTKRYGRTEVLRGVDLSVARGEFAVLVGPSGSGKSTVLHLLAGLEPADEGELIVDERHLTHHVGHLNHFRREQVGIVFQLHNLIPRLTARENVEAAMFSTHRGKRRRVERATELLERLDLVNRADEHPATMSGGERQRVAVARALANEPAVLLADEPTGSLDEDSAAIVLALFAERVAAGTTVLAVSHDDRLNARADRLIELVGGRVTEDA